MQEDQEVFIYLRGEGNPLLFHDFTSAPIITAPKQPVPTINDSGPATARAPIYPHPVVDAVANIQYVGRSGPSICDTDGRFIVRTDGCDGVCFSLEGLEVGDALWLRVLIGMWPEI